MKHRHFCDLVQQVDRFLPPVCPWQMKTTLYSPENDPDLLMESASGRKPGTLDHVDSLQARSCVQLIKMYYNSLKTLSFQGISLLKVSIFNKIIH